MKKTLEMMNTNLKDMYLTIYDDFGHMIEGVFNHAEWVIPNNIYTGGNFQLKCFVGPKFDDDKDRFDFDEDTGLAEMTFDVDTIKFVRLDNDGNIINNTKM